MFKANLHFDVRNWNVRNTTQTDVVTQKLSRTKGRRRVKKGESETQLSFRAETKPATIASLPIELLLLIVRRFDIRFWRRLESVNRQFRIAVSAAWRELRHLDLESLFGFSPGNNAKFLGKEFRERAILRKFLQTLSIRSPFIATLDGLPLFSHRLSPDILEYICRLEKLERFRLVRNQFFPASNVVLLAGRATSASNLLHLNLSGCLGSGSVSDSASGSRQMFAAVQLALPMMTLRELIYRDNHYGRGACLARMNCKRLTLLDVAGSEIDSELLHRLLRRSINLTHLDLSSSIDQPTSTVSSEILRWLRSARRLISLKLNDYSERHKALCDTFSVPELQQSLFDLGAFGVFSELEMTNCWFCTNAMINAITDGLRKSMKILRFDIDRCTGDYLMKIAKRMSNLEELVFWTKRTYCLNLNAPIVLAVANRLPKLCKLVMNRTSASPRTLESLIRLKHLRELTLIGGLRNQSLIMISSAIGDQLISLTLRGCSELCDEGLAPAAAHLPNLRSLELGFCSITDRSLTALAWFCRELRTLKLTNCRQINNQGAQEILDSCQNMEEFCLCGTSAKVLTLYNYIGKSCFFKRISTDAILDVTFSETILKSVNSCRDDNFKSTILSNRDYYCI